MPVESKVISSVLAVSAIEGLPIFTSHESADFKTITIREKAEFEDVQMLKSNICERMMDVGSRLCRYSRGVLDQVREASE